MWRCHWADHAAGLALKASTGLHRPPIPRYMATTASRRAVSSGADTGAVNGSRRVAQKSIKAAYYRGGTSRAIMFKQENLPEARSDWAPVFLGAIGSPDPEHGRQLDGMGGGISSLSKACVVGPATVEGADVDYTFAALGVRDSSVDYASNCGNMSAAIGPFAVDSGLVHVPPTTVYGLVLRNLGLGNRLEQGAPETPPVIGAAPDDVNFTVRIHNTNTGKIIKATFPLAASEEADSGVEAAASGSYAIDGVAGTGAPIRLDFLDPSGSRTGKLLPTGNTVDDIKIPARGSGAALAVRATLIDAGNPCCFVTATDLGVADGTMTAAAIDADEALKSRLEAVRQQAAVMMGLAEKVEDAPGSVPKIAFVSRQPAAAGASSDAVTVRAMSVGQPHKAVPLTVAIALAAAARLPGSVVAGCVVPPAEAPETSAEDDSTDDKSLIVRHASGTLTVGAKFSEQGHLEHATVYRTARRLMEGRVFWK